MSFRKRLLEMIKEGEGSIPHMYLDTRGYVTVGVGQMLPSAERALELDFVERAGRAQAGGEAVRADYDSVKSREPGRAAGNYKKFTQLDLPEEKIDELLERRLNEFEAGLKREFPDYDDYPEDARLGLMDMAYNLGLSGLVNKFPSFVRAARNRDWSGCAKECQRRGIGDHRNEATRKLFENA